MSTTIGSIAADVAKRFDRMLVDYGDQWARIRMVAAAIPPDVDLDDQAEIVRTLFAARLCAADFSDILSEATEAARDNRRFI